MTDDEFSVVCNFCTSTYFQRIQRKNRNHAKPVILILGVSISTRCIRYGQISLWLVGKLPHFILTLAYCCVRVCSEYNADTAIWTNCKKETNEFDCLALVK